MQADGDSPLSGTNGERVRFDIGVPSGAIKHYSSWSQGRSLGEFAAAAERCGFDSVHVTDHPFPDDAWLANGGHQAFDPFIALTLMGAATSTLRLRTNLLVAGYRNPYLTARAVASLDVLSGGRTIVGMGAGYLKSEFAVLGANFERRGQIFDETIEAMTAAWSGRSVVRDRAFPAPGHTMLPPPVQGPRPPIWIGGNSAAARRRAANLGDGWIPMRAGATLAAITGTAPLENLDALAASIAEIAELRRARGADSCFDVAVGGFGMPLAADDPDGSAAVASIAEHAAAGVTWLSLPCVGRSLSACIDEMEHLGELVIAPSRAAVAVGSQS